MKNNTTPIFSSFRDPSGFVFRKNGLLLRQVNNSYADIYDHVIETDLFNEAIENDWIVKFDEVEIEKKYNNDAYKVLMLEEIPFISYPYEWSFSQIKDAALLTLKIHLSALEKGLLLKDASIYNIQFVNGKPIFIDHLSFDLIDRYSAWPAYGQYCRHFLAPLALMSHADIRFNQLFRIYLDGIPLDFAANLMKIKTKFRPGLLMHLHLHAKSQIKHSDSREKKKDLKKLNKKQLIAIAHSLNNTIKRIQLRQTQTEWGDYYSDTNYSEIAMQSKRDIIKSMLEHVSPKKVWDLGGNTGEMSRLATSIGSQVVSFDIDPVAVEKNYLKCCEEKNSLLLPLIMDFTNPSPPIGFDNRERNSLSQRACADLLLALALIHHLAISNNLPFEYLAEYFSTLGNWLIIEFVPKNDSQVQRLLVSREDIFENYTYQSFESCFSKYFKIHQKKQIGDSERTIYLLEKK